MELTANAVQTVASNGNVLFTATAVPGSCSIIHRQGSGLVNLRGVTQQCRSRFRISFGGNVALATGATVGPITLALAIDGEVNSSTSMIVTPAAVGDYFNVFSSMFLNVPRGDNYSISIKNLSGVNIDIQNANLIVERVA